MNYRSRHLGTDVPFIWGDRQILGVGRGIPSRPVARLRKILQLANKGPLGTLLAVLRSRAFRGRSHRIMIFSDGKVMTSEQQLAPLMRHRNAIAAQMGLVFDFRQTQQIGGLKPADLKGYDIIGLKLAWNTPDAEAKATAEALFSMAKQVGAKALVLDGDDDQNVLWPEVIAASDIYLKKHRFAEDAGYKRAYMGKSNLTDYVSTKYDVSFESYDIPRAAPLAQNQIDKIVLGWNIALDDKIYNLSRDISPEALQQDRDLDIVCRASVAPGVWTHAMRNGAVEAVTALGATRRVLAPKDRVSQQEYYDEMLRARMTVSPFGFGELCWRDFEAILCGSVLVKQDMSHVKTWPNLFVPHETYIPVAWDFSNLEEVCAPYLEEKAACERIARNARSLLLHALSPEGFLTRLTYVIEQIRSTEKTR